VFSIAPVTYLSQLVSGGNLVNGKFYSGFIYDRRADYLFQTPPETSWDKYVTGANPPTSPDIPASPPQYRWGNGWVQISTSNRYDDMILEPFPKGLNAINFGTILKRIAKICGFTFSELSDLTSAFKFAQPQWLGFYVVPNTAYTHPKDLTLIYQYAFGINPADGITEYANSSGYSWSTSLSEIVKDIALQLGAHIYTEVSNPGNGQPPSLRLRILSRRTEKGTKPNNWQIKQNGSKEQPRKINKTSVEVKNGASEGSMFCPVQSKETIQITQKWRVRKWGNLTPDNIFTTDNFNHDIKKLPVEQDSHLRIKDSGKPNKLGGSAWVLGTYLYAPALELGGTTLNRAYPDNWGIPLDGNSFNAIMWVLDKETKVELRMNTQYSASQLFAQELVNNPLVLERTYIGVADDNRMISTIQPGMETSFRFIGQMTTFRAFEIEQDIIKNETKVKWYSKPEDYSALADLPIVLQGEAGAVTGGSSNTANSAGIQTQDIGSTFLVPVIREIPNGVINGINTSFSISQVPKLNTEQIYLNGVLLEPGNEEDYTMSGATINFNYAPLIGDRIRVSFIK